jgi:hypothetical protein
MQHGLPEPRGSLTSVLASHEAEPHVFYAGNNKGIFRSTDTGLTWQELSIPWPTGTQVGRVDALIAVLE